MFLRSYYDEQLAHMSYLAGCQKTGEALVIDPSRNIGPYLKTAENEGFRITAIAETHIHADYASGTRELAKSTNARLYLSDEGNEDWKYSFAEEFKHEWLKDGSVFHAGNIELKVMHTPGHTPESISFILTDKGGGSNIPMGIFTGDFLFVGDIGRPDLLETAAGMRDTAKKGAEDMYLSIQKLKELPDYLQVWPAHGAGSACGKSLGAVPSSTIGYERVNNWALKHWKEEEFVKELLAGQPETPNYFGHMKKINKEGPDFLSDRPIPRITEKQELEKKLSEADCQLIDTRPAKQFKKQFLIGFISIPFNSKFANWAGWLLDYDRPAVIIAAEDQEDDIKRTMASIGYDRIETFCAPELIEQFSNTESYHEINVSDLKESVKDENVYLIDVRNDSEWKNGHIDEAHHHMLGKLKKAAEGIPKDKNLMVHCQSGTRSAIAVSVLKAAGFDKVQDITGGYAAWEKENYPVKK